MIDLGATPTFAMALGLALARLLDARFGEPRQALHPVVWLGSVLGPVGRGLRSLPPTSAFIGGALAWCVLATLLGAAAWWLQRHLSNAALWWAVPCIAILIKPCFAWRMLHDEVAVVDSALAQGTQGTHDTQDSQGLPAARMQLARLVSRDVHALDATGVREAAIETLAENLNDSLVAPLFWFVLFGLPGAVVYRFANTADAMWGYRGRWEWAGKWAARADDVLSWLPARLTALLLRPSLRWRDWCHLASQARLTPSPNGGWPMGAMALRLGVHLRKPGTYALNAEAPAPQARHVAAALRRARTAAHWALGTALLLVSVRSL